MATESDDLKDARQQFAASADMWSTVRQEFADDLRFARLGEQWPEVDRNNRILDARPCLTINRLPAFIRQVVNDARQNKPQIKVRPADGGADVETANIFSGIIRNIESVSSSGIAYDTGIDMAVSGGFGFWRIDLEYANDFSFDLEPRINRIANPLTVYFDPMTQSATSDDWRYCFVADMMPKEEFESQYPDADVSDFDEDDKNFPWVDNTEGEQGAIRVAEWWRREEDVQTILKLSNGLIVYEHEYEKPETKALFDASNTTVVASRKIPAYKVTHQLITGSQVLEEKTEWVGKYIPIVPVYGDEINVEGKRHFRSMIRDAKDPQRMFNYWRTAATELVALAPRAPWIGKKGSFETDAEKWATANTRSHAFIEYDGPEKPQREPFDGVPAGALSEAANAADDMKAILGVFDPSLGERSNETSGRAIIARQRESDNGTFNFIDNLSRSIEQTGRILVDIIPRVYTEQKIVRILGEDGKTRNVTIGKAPQGAPPNAAPAPPPMQPGQMPPGQMPTMPQPDPAMQAAAQQAQAIERIYDLSAGKYDVVVAAGPSFTTRRDEAANQINNIMTAYPQSAVILAPELVRNLDMPNADKIARAFEAMQPPNIKAAYNGQPPPPPQPPPEVQVAQQKAQADMAINQQKAQTDAQISHQKAQQDFALEQQRAQAQQQREMAQAEADIAVMHKKADAEVAIEQRKAELKFALMQKEAELSARLKLATAAAQAAQSPGVE